MNPTECDVCVCFLRNEGSIWSGLLFRKWCPSLLDQTIPVCPWDTLEISLITSVVGGAWNLRVYDTFFKSTITRMFPMELKVSVSLVIKIFK